MAHSRSLFCPRVTITNWAFEWITLNCVSKAETFFRLRGHRWGRGGRRPEARKLRDGPSNPARALQRGHSQENRAYPRNDLGSLCSLGSRRQPIRQLGELPKRSPRGDLGRGRTEASPLFRGRSGNASRRQDRSKLPPDSDQIFAGLLNQTWARLLAPRRGLFDTWP